MKKLSGKARIKTTLSNLIIKIGSLEMLQVGEKVEVSITYEWDAGSPATEFEPPSLPVLECTKILLQEQCIFVDDCSQGNLKLWKHSDLVNVLSEAQLQEIDSQVEAELKEAGKESFELPEDVMYKHKPNWRDKL